MPSAATAGLGILTLSRRLSRATRTRTCATRPGSPPHASIRSASALAARTPDGGDPWDRIGLACARLEIGDVSGVDDLLRWAAEGDPHQQRVASLALYRGVAPLLEAVGRWPIQYTVREGQPWPTDWSRRFAGGAAGWTCAIAADTRPHVVRAAVVRRDVGRLNATRERLARFLLTH